MRQPWWEEVPVVSPRVAYIPATMATLYLGPLSKLGGGDREETGIQRREAFTWHTNTLLAGTRASPKFKEAASARKALCPPLLGRQPLLGRPGSGSRGGLGKALSLGAFVARCQQFLWHLALAALWYSFPGIYA